MSTASSLQESFVEQLPWMQKTARLAFLNLDPEKRAEAVAAVIALAWKAWHRLGERGKADNPAILKSVLYYAQKQQRAQRRVDSAAKPKDVLSLRSYGKVNVEPWNLGDYIGKETPVLEQVSFRIDVPAFMKTLPERNRKLALDLSRGMSTSEAAKKYGVSPGRISQFRREFKVLFDRFFGE